MTQSPWYFGLSEIHRPLQWHLGLQEIMHIAGIRYASELLCLEEILHENQFNLHFDLKLLCFWMVINIINSIARGGPPCVLATLRSEHCGRGAPANVACAERA